MSQTLDELADVADKAADLIRHELAMPGSDAVRAAMNDAGIVRARQRVNDALDILDKSQIDYRKAQEAEREAKEAFETALAEAEWELDGRFVTEGNKTFLVTPSPTFPDIEDATERKAMTADERAKWKSLEARKLPAVAKAASGLRKAEATTADRRDAITIADKTLSAARADLDAAIAVLTAWTAVLPRRSAA